jgi:cyclomaltodextrinase / maltogenic alpha-amylase / neopullulanase
MKNIKSGYYRHFKGNKYLVLGIAKHSETLEEYVSYISLYENNTSQLWVRPISSFLEQVELNGKIVPRFEYLGEN